MVFAVFLSGEPPPLPAVTFASSTRSSGGGGGGGTGGRATGNRSSSRVRRQQKQQQAKVKDQSGTNLVANDASGFGLKRPYLAWNVYPTAEETAPARSTTSATFVALLTAAIEPQHPRIRVRVRAVTGAATSGEVRLRDRVTGQVIAGPLVVGTATTVESNLEGALVAPSLSGAGAPMKVDVEARTTAGASTIAVLVVYAIGVGT